MSAVGIVSYVWGMGRKDFLLPLRLQTAAARNGGKSCGLHENLAPKSCNLGNRKGICNSTLCRVRPVVNQSNITPTTSGSPELGQPYLQISDSGLAGKECAVLLSYSSTLEVFACFQCVA